MSKRLCIVSSNLLRCDAFIPALTSLSRDDELEIIIDRRRGDAADRPAEERRSRPYLDLALKVDGFAIVPWAPAVPSSPQAVSPAPLSAAPPPRPGPIAATLPEITPPTPLRSEPPSPLDRFVIDYDEESDRERLERILNFKTRRRVGPLAGLLIVTAMAVAIFAMVPSLRAWVGLVVADMRQATNPSQPAGQAADTKVATQTLPPVTEAPSTERKTEAAAVSPPVASQPSDTASAEPPSTREPLAPPALPAEPSTRKSAEPRTPTEPSPRKSVDPRTSTEPSTRQSNEPRTSTEPSTRTPGPRSTPATPRITPPPIAGARVATAGPVKREVSPSLPGVPRVELSRPNTRSTDGDVYTVRVSDVGGRPLAGADILLLARMSDGTAASIPLNSGAEPGMYQGTMPSGRSSLVDLRVRVTTNDKRVEIPFAP